MKDEREITSKREGQEYAHNYPLENRYEYQYPHESKRIKYLVDSDSSNNKNVEDLYGVTPEPYHVETPQSIRVRQTKEQVLQENMQRSYRIQNKPPINTKTDPGTESYALPNDFREDEISHIEKGMNNFNQKLVDEHGIDISDAGQRASLSETLIGDGFSGFQVGDKVFHNEEGLDGEVSFNNGTRITIIWADKTRERFTLGEANQYLTVHSYVSDAQEMVDPIHTPAPRKDNNSLSSASEVALGIMEDEEELVLDENPTEMDIEKIKLQRKVGELQNKIEEIDVDKIKKQAASELIDLMLKKGMVENKEDAIQYQMENIMKMDDVGYEAFKNVVLSTKSGVEDVLAILDENEDEDDGFFEDGFEYVKMKEELKKTATPKRTVDGIEMGDTSFLENGGLRNLKPTIGGFGDATSTSSTQTESRSLSANKKEHKAIEKKSSLDFSGFQDLQGLTKPINISPKEYTPGMKYSELLKDLKWTTISK